jgi:hypothetical protein
VVEVNNEYACKFCMKKFYVKNYKYSESIELLSYLVPTKWMKSFGGLLQAAKWHVGN